MPVKVTPCKSGEELRFGGLGVCQLCSGNPKEGLVSTLLMEHKHSSNFNTLWLHLFQMQTAALAVSFSIAFAKKCIPCLLSLLPCFL